MGLVDDDDVIGELTDASSPISTPSAMKTMRGAGPVIKAGATDISVRTGQPASTNRHR